MRSCRASPVRLTAIQPQLLGFFILEIVCFFGMGSLMKDLQSFFWSCRLVRRFQRRLFHFRPALAAMLRLTPPNYGKIRVANTFEASYGGSEANIALALANLGVDSTFFSVVPNNSLGKSAVRALRSNDVHCTPVILSTSEETPTHRLGTYYLETGYGIRPSKVTYDRKHSAISEYDFSALDVGALLGGL